MNCRLEFRLSDSEKSIILNKATSAGLSVSSYLRATAVSARVYNNTQRFQQIKEINSWLGRICGNIHAISSYANRSKNPSAALITERLGEIKELVLGFRV